MVKMRCFSCWFREADIEAEFEAENEKANCPRCKSDRTAKIPPPWLTAEEINAARSFAFYDLNQS